MSETIVKGRKKVAEHFQVTERQVGNWILQGMPVLSGRRFDLVQVQIWRDRKKGLLPQAPEGQIHGDPRQPSLKPEDKDFWDKEGKRYQAELRKLEYRQRLGQLVERHQVEEMFIGRLTACKAGLLALARALPPLLISCQNEREMETVVSGAVRRLLLAFSRPLPENLGSGRPQSGGEGGE